MVWQPLFRISQCSSEDVAAPRQTAAAHAHRNHPLLSRGILIYMCLCMCTKSPTCTTTCSIMKTSMPCMYRPTMLMCLFTRLWIIQTRIPKAHRMTACLCNSRKYLFFYVFLTSNGLAMASYCHGANMCSCAYVCVTTVRHTNVHGHTHVHVHAHVHGMCKARSSALYLFLFCAHFLVWIRNVLCMMI
jgi:hypothetical protein